MGRHWWGKLVNERPEPVIGEEARALADALGLPTLSANSMGTTIAVLDPILIMPMRVRQHSPSGLIAATPLAKDDSIDRRR